MGGNQSVGGITTEPASPTVVKTNAEWKAQLTKQQFNVCIKHGTEHPNSGRLTKSEIYGCVCCHSPLFLHTEKFESGSGWPAFYKPKEGCVRHVVDKSMGMKRTEVRCRTCEAHLGHVFSDGKPLRYCINAVCLEPFNG
mmetsp:Transcript_24192/g.46872  ORF Transcript_24192/g.46872 Transcript_24192/m.46872 type:complete len:139 (-) Transcript_24192:162-578(-)|eukprot:CAMPEP_0173393346 /NCGR_PEP_ID=MMETSP1356-20130122/22058_1 /TAXON_ID=77927 ORGANISM="Hemiselmis virescens, Strain PCC157" /NCGR_SAMPLE_ID=MMETSP1356 /ASSEMBLY_ACC=CAM_ASM_000847 /LENGTH=138 /DNA_ID=CAMNT_0014351351 /DNA_START=9 /DNA_END=425 /DNA_ORIENTATION=-